MEIVNFLEIQSAFWVCLQNGLEFFNEILNLSFNRDILLRYLEVETSVHAEIVTTHYYILFTDFLARKLTLGILFDLWSWLTILSTWLRHFFEKRILVCKLYTVFLLSLLHPNFNFIACIEVNISSKKVHARMCFQVESNNYIDHVIYRAHSSRCILVKKFVNSMY